MADPENCLKFMKEVIFKCVGGIENLNPKENTNNQMGVYEKLLQKAEIKIRDLIRVIKKCVLVKLISK